MNTVVVKKIQIEQGVNTDPYGITKLTVKDLKLELKERGLPITGLKAVLRDRLLQHMIAQCGNGDDAVEDDEVCEVENVYDTVEDDELHDAMV